MKPDLTLSEAFELYRKDVIVYKNQSAKTEENESMRDEIHCRVSWRHSDCLSTSILRFAMILIRRYSFQNSRKAAKN